MRNFRVMVILPILIISWIFAAPFAIPRGHSSAGGVVCLSHDGAKSCPLEPALINATLPPAPKLRVPILVNSSDALIGFDITIIADSSIIQPFDVDTATNTLLTWTAIPVKCIANSGTGCVSGIDNANTIHVSASAQALSFSPATGVLFTAIFTVVGAAYSTPISFQTGCGSGTSVPGGVCVTITNGSTTVDAESTQNAKFSNRPYFDLEPVGTTSTLRDAIGTIDTSLTLNVTSVNALNATVTLVVQITPPSSAITVAFGKNPLKVNLTSFPSNTQDFSPITVNVTSSASPGNYTLTFTGTSNPTTAPNFLVIPLTVPAPDYSLTPKPATLSFNVTASNTTQITLTSLYSFTGRVSLTLSIPPNVQAGLQASSLVVPKGGSVSTTLTVNSTVAGNYLLNITAVATGAPSHTVTIRLTVLDYEMVAVTGLLVIPQRSSTPEIIRVEAVKGATYNVTVTISKISIYQTTSTGSIEPASGITVTCFPRLVNVTIIRGGTGSTPENTVCTVLGTTIGNYTVTVVGTSGKSAGAVSFPVIVTGPDFTLVATPPVRTVDQGTTATVSLLIIQQLGLTSNVTLAQTITGNDTPLPTATFNVQKTLLDATHLNGTVIITITAPATTPTGPYTLTLTATATTTSQQHTIPIIIVVTTTSSPHDLAVDRVTPSPTQADVGASITIIIEVANLGKTNENSTVTALAGTITVGKPVNVTLTIGQKMNVTITWDTTGFTPGPYIITGQIAGVKGETVLSNNFWTYQTPVTLTTANSSVLQSPYLVPSIIIAAVAVIAIISAILLQARRRKTPTQ